MGTTKEAWVKRKERYGNSGVKNPEKKNKSMSDKLKGRDVSSWVWKTHEKIKEGVKNGKIRYDKEYSRNWKGGTSFTSRKIRSSKEYGELRIKVFKRDSYVCQYCGKKGGFLEAHHIKSFAKHPKLRFKIKNIVTLCRSCHRKTDTYGHKIYNQ